MSKKKAPKRITPIRKDQVGNFIPTISNTKAPVTINNHFHQHFYSDHKRRKPTFHENKEEPSKILDLIGKIGKAVLTALGLF